MKSLYYTLRVLTITALLSFYSEVAADTTQLIPTTQEFCDEIASLPVTGVLYQREKNGDIILKISDEYLEKICKFIDCPSTNMIQPDLGAHISVFRPVFDGVRLADIPELGQEFSFNIMGFGGVVPVSDRYCYVYFLMVHSPELTNLRLKYGMEPYLHGDHAFHITLGLVPIHE